MPLRPTLPTPTKRPSARPLRRIKGMRRPCFAPCALPILIESALLREVDIGKNLKYYLPNPDNNAQVAQVICLDCDKIFEINAPFMEWYGNSVSSKLGLTPVSQRLQVTAHCITLKQTGVCKHRN